MGLRDDDDNDAIFDNDGDAFCGICYFKRYIRCAYCDAEIYAKDHDEWTTNVNKETMCVNCYNKNYFKCSNCGEEFSIKKSNELGDELYCNDCFENAKNQTDTNETNG